MLNKEYIKNMAEEIGKDIKEVVKVHMRMDNMNSEKLTAILFAIRSACFPVLMTLVTTSTKRGHEEKLIVEFFDSIKNEALEALNEYVKSKKTLGEFLCTRAEAAKD